MMMKTLNIRLILSLLSISLLSLHESYSQQIKLPDYLYEEFRKTPSPINHVKIKINPTELQWPSEKYWHKKNVTYNVYLSQDSLFQPEKTIKSENQRYCFYNPHKALNAGTWYWKYEIVEKGKTETKGIYSFTVTANTPKFETPSFDEFVSSISKKHPRVMNQGNDIHLIRKQASSHPAFNTITKKGNAVLKHEIYNGPLEDKDPAKSKKLQGVFGKEIKRFHEALQAYVLTGQKDLFENLLQRIQVLLTWPTNDLLGSQVLTALSMSYDVLYDELSLDIKTLIIQCIEKQMRVGLKRWPGLIESRQVENHFWQTEVAGNFSAALATIHDSEVAKDMLKYTYELYIARFPNLSTKEDGGWAEGMGYFGVNKSCVIDMAVLMKKIAKVDIFQMPWYQSLPDYYTYFAPVGGQVSGFGDMHDRIKDGTTLGISSSLVLAHEINSPSANYRLASQLNKSPKKEQLLNDTEAWYQIVNNVKINPDSLKQPKRLPNDKVFYSTGIAAMHNQILKPAKGTSVFFRSSPFGAKGHMHANQNSFNIARKGERLFYSTGYYTSFADPHSMTSYRNTRAHNTILVNGCGQSFGHEGYGFIKRHLSGKELTYVCGDATAAYKPTVDKQFLSMNAESGVKETREYGVGDAQLKLFERHLVFIRPDIVVIYDILESKQDCDWTFLLHTMKNQQPDIDKQGNIRVITSKNAACVNVFGSEPIEATYTDQFFSPAIDFKKKYREVPNQYHISYKTKTKSKSMRYLSVIQLGNKEAKLMPVRPNAQGEITLGDILITGELNTNKPAGMTVKTAKSTLKIQTHDKKGKVCSILEQNGKMRVAYNRYPEQIKHN